MVIVHIDKFDSDECMKGGEHDFSEAVLTYLTRKKEERHINQDHFLIAGTHTPKKQYRRMKIVGGQERCSKCKMPYMMAHNPFFME